MSMSRIGLPHRLAARREASPSNSSLFASLDLDSHAMRMEVLACPQLDMLHARSVSTNICAWRLLPRPFPGWREQKWG